MEDVIGLWADVDYIGDDRHMHYADYKLFRSVDDVVRGELELTGTELM